MGTLDGTGILGGSGSGKLLTEEFRTVCTA